MSEKNDPVISELIGKEIEREKETINLIASENYVSKNVLKVVGSILTNKYAEGYPGRRYYDGCENMDGIESIAIKRAKDLLMLNTRMSSLMPEVRQTLAVISFSSETG